MQPRPSSKAHCFFYWLRVYFLAFSVNYCRFSGRLVSRSSLLFFLGRSYFQIVQIEDFTLFHQVWFVSFSFAECPATYYQPEFPSRKLRSTWDWNVGSLSAPVVSHTPQPLPLSLLLCPFRYSQMNLRWSRIGAYWSGRFSPFSKSWYRETTQTSETYLGFALSDKRGVYPGASGASMNNSCAEGSRFVVILDRCVRGLNHEKDIFNWKDVKIGVFKVYNVKDLCHWSVLAKVLKKWEHALDLHHHSAKYNVTYTCRSNVGTEKIKGHHVLRVVQYAHINKTDATFLFWRLRVVQQTLHSFSLRRTRRTVAIESFVSSCGLIAWAGEMSLQSTQNAFVVRENAEAHSISSSFCYLTTESTDGGHWALLSNGWLSTMLCWRSRAPR